MMLLSPKPQPQPMTLKLLLSLILACASAQKDGGGAGTACDMGGASATYTETIDTASGCTARRTIAVSYTHLTLPTKA